MKFPDKGFFMVGPQSASVLANMIEAIEHQVDWLVDGLLAKMEDTGQRVVECTRASELEWTRQCDAQTAKTVWGGIGGGCKSWYNKANMETQRGSGSDGASKADGGGGGGGQVLPFTGGLTEYQKRVAEKGLDNGLVFT